MTVTAVLPPAGTRVRVVSGSYIRKMAGTVVYTSSVPLFYEFGLNLTEIQPIFIKENDCDHHGMQCEVIKSGETYLEAIGKRLHLLRNSMEVTPYGPSQRTNSVRYRRNLVTNIVSDAIGDFLSYCCSVVSHRELESVFTTQEAMNQLIAKMKKSIIQDHTNILQIKRGFEEYTTNLTSALRSFRQAMGIKLQSIQKQFNSEKKYLDWFESYTDRLGIMIFHIIQHLNQATELQHYNDILSHCHSQLIPLTAIPAYVLKADLRTLNQELRVHDHELALSPENVGEYYTHKMAACHFTENKIGISIRAPVKPVSENFDLYEVITVPFIFADSVCTMAHAPTFLATSQHRVLPIH